MDVIRSTRGTLLENLKAIGVEKGSLTKLTNSGLGACGWNADEYQ